MNVEWRCKTEQSAASSSTDQWTGGDVPKHSRNSENEEKRGNVRGEGSSRDHEELVMVRLPSDQERKGSTHEEQEEGELGRRKVVKKLDPQEPTKEEREETGEEKRVGKVPQGIMKSLRLLPKS